MGLSVGTWLGYVGYNRREALRSDGALNSVVMVGNGSWSAFRRSCFLQAAMACRDTRLANRRVTRCRAPMGVAAGCNPSLGDIFGGWQGRLEVHSRARELRAVNEGLMVAGAFCCTSIY